MRNENCLETEITDLLADPEYEGHPAREALHSLFRQYNDQLTQLERLTSISDGYHSALREHNQTLSERYRRQIRQLKKIVRISDHYQRVLQEFNEKLILVATQDPLTGLPNRRLIMEQLETEVALADRHGQIFSVALIDIDHFKQINDRFGHVAGDAVLVTIAREFHESLRASDSCARWGGEEFLILFRQTVGNAAQEIANRLRQRIEHTPLPNLPAATLLSISIGVTEYHTGTTLLETINRADKALYKAKHSGRNRVVLSP